MKHALGALAVIALGAALLFWVFGSGESVRAYLDRTCQFTGHERDSSGHRARGYSCPRAPKQTAKDLRDRHKPADQRNTAAGYFLRYSDDMVGITGAPQRGRSRVYLADERNGYGYFNSYVGGHWGTYSGRAESFRGGGSGTGK